MINNEIRKIILCSAEMRSSRSLQVWKLGTVNYLEALKLQEKLVSDRKVSKIPDTLLSLQHPPTYTLGKRRTDHNLLIPTSKLQKIGAELHFTHRVGDITYHGNNTFLPQANLHILPKLIYPYPFSLLSTPPRTSPN